MEHAHPLPDGYCTPSRQSSQISYTSGVVQSSPKNVNRTPPSYETLNPQSRILQLRNAGFRGPIISGRRISPIFGPSLHEPSVRPINDENSPRTSDRRTLYGEDLPPNPVNILQEIHNSTRRRFISPKASFGAIFQDNTSGLAVQEACGISWYNEESNSCSPSPSNGGPVKMKKPREKTLNDSAPPPLSSPLAKQVKSRKMNRVNLRSASFEASKYIEHLESQLTAVNAKLELLSSPTRNRERSKKLRDLSTEVRSLRLDISDWERNFEDRVQEEIHGRVEYETGMKSRIQTLEDEMEIKDSKMRELEWEIEGMRNMVQEAEGLKEINLNLERRIDVLTNLVVQSPTKVDLYSASPSPITTDPTKQTPRPKSLIPRLPSSSGGVRLSLNTKVEATFWDSKRFASSSSISMSPGGASNSIEEEDDDDDEISLEPMSRELLTRPLSCTSASFRSLPSFPTRPTSTRSAIGLTSPEIPFPADFDSQTRSANRQRRMRRFPSGSCTLKPLILPNAAFTPSVPASAPLYTDSDVRRDISNTSLDPTVAFLSKNDENSPICTPTQPSRQRSATWAQEEKLSVPRERFQSSAESQEESLREFVLANDALDTPREGLRDHHKPKRPRPLSLDKELELANFLSPNQFEDGLIAADVGDTTKFKSTPTAVKPSCSEQFSRNTDSRQRISQPISTPKIFEKQEVFKTPPKTALSNVVTNENASGIFARLTGLMSYVNQDPVILAKRLLYNAWNLGSTRLGGIRWWFLGLVFRSHGLGRLSAADRKIVEEHSSNIFNWQYFSAQASRRRTVEHSLRNQGEIAYANNHELAFRGISNTRDMFNSTSLSSLGISPSSPPGIVPHLFPCNECVEPSSHRSFRLWINFSLAIILAVGVAIRHGPGTLLVDHSSHLFHTCHQPPETESYNKQASSTCSSQSTKVESSRESSGDADPESAAGGEEIVFAEILGPRDFEHLA